MDEMKKYENSDVMVLPDLHPVKKMSDAEKARIAETLLEIADEARNFSYSPYSGYTVGAALLTNTGSIYTGTNVETAALSGVCAERNALFKAISDGNKCFVALAVSGGMKGKASGACSPCGVCRQVFSEFVNPEDFFVIFRTGEEDTKIVNFGELLPFAFGPDSFK